MKRIYTTINKKGNLNDISKEELLKIEDLTGGGGTNNQNNINRIPSATYSELGINPESTIEEKQTAIATFLEGYNNLETDNLFFEILQDVEPEPESWELGVTTQVDNYEAKINFSGAISFNIDWGDGTINSGLTQGYQISHTYSVAGDYVIKLWGSFNNGTIQLGELSPNPNFFLLNEILKTTSVIKGISGLQNFESVFNNCTELTSIPQGLFQYQVDALSFKKAFQNCTGLTSIPEDLFENNIHAVDFDLTFTSCTGLTSVPENLFNYQTNILSVNSIFSNCAGITSNLPELWSMFPSAAHQYAFYRCTQALNYNNVPSDWK